MNTSGADLVLYDWYCISLPLILIFSTLPFYDCYTTSIQCYENIFNPMKLELLKDALTNNFSE